MMHGHEKSDSAIVAMKPRTKPSDPPRSRWSEGRGPRGMRASKARAGRRTGKACPRRWSAYGRAARQRKKETVHRALPPSQRCDAAGQAFFALKRDAAPGVDGLTWRDYEADLDRQTRGPARTGAPRSLSGAAVTAAVHTEAGWPAAAARDCRPRGQDRPTGRRVRPGGDLRGGFSRLLVWIPTGARPARCAGCSPRRDLPEASELDA